MSVTREGDIVRLAGRCGAEEAETLLAVLASGARKVELEGCDHLHTALVQLLLAADVEVDAAALPFLDRWVLGRA